MRWRQDGLVFAVSPNRAVVFARLGRAGLQPVRPIRGFQPSLGRQRKMERDVSADVAYYLIQTPRGYKLRLAGVGVGAY